MNGEVTGHVHRDYSGAKLGMWLFLLTEAMFFFGPVLLYAVFRYRFPSEFSAASRELDLATGAINTAVLITSSLLAASAVSALKRGSRNLAAALLIGHSDAFPSVVLCALAGGWFMSNNFGKKKS